MIPTNAPIPLGKELIIRVYVDAVVGEQVSMRSRSGLVVIPNISPVFGSLRSKAILRLDHSKVSSLCWNNFFELP